jgi:hypothetical protein
MGEEGMKTWKTFEEVADDIGWPQNMLRNYRLEGWDACLANAIPDEPEGVTGRVKLNMTADEAHQCFYMPMEGNLDPWQRLLDELQRTATVQPASDEEIEQAFLSTVPTTWRALEDEEKLDVLCVFRELTISRHATATDMEIEDVLCTIPRGQTPICGRISPDEYEQLIDAIRPLTVARSEGFEVDWSTAEARQATGVRLVYTTFTEAEVKHGMEYAGYYQSRPVAKMRPINREEMIASLRTSAPLDVTGEYIFARLPLDKYDDATLLGLCKNTAGIALEIEDK